ncbi:MAG TPA: biosynthetic-type acetolactate synthase large subunit [Thermoflexus sp.]|nr:biosynthetic-type acetolactate synthase large subunit [Thermoflexus sp.]
MEATTIAQTQVAPRTIRRERRRMKTAWAVMEALVREGVEVIFGVPGGASLPLYDALYDYPQIRHVLVRHEQCAIHMAEGYARATGRPGVCFTTSGPGATNLVTGLTDAMMDSTPVVAITGQVPTFFMGGDAFQEADVIGLTMSVTKHNWLVRTPAKAVEAVHTAFRLATDGRPGPVLVDLPRDVLLAETEFAFEDPQAFRPARPRPSFPDEEALRRAADLIAGSQRPILYVGGGAIHSGAAPEIRALAEKARIPVTTTLMGLGAFPEDHPYSLKMLGMHGTVYANFAINFSDLIIAVGARFDDRVTGKLSAFAPHAKVIHIDIDPAEINKNRKADVALIGDAKQVLRALLPMVRPPDTEAWWRQIQDWKARYPLRYRQGDDVIKPQFAIQMIYELTKEYRPIVTIDVGQHQMWAAQFFTWTEPRTCITSGGLGTMGFSLPAAVGAQFGRPDRLVININGDGSFQMTFQALITAVEWRLPIKVFIINNQYLGMVRQWQELFYNRRYSAVYLANPDFARLAEAVGAAGIRVERPDQVEPAIRQALAITDRPVVVDILVDPEENCFPMIPSGMTVFDMMVAPGVKATP